MIKQPHTQEIPLVQLVVRTILLQHYYTHPSTNQAFSHIYLVTPPLSHALHHTRPPGFPIFDTWSDTWSLQTVSSTAAYAMGPHHSLTLTESGSGKTLKGTMNHPQEPHSTACK